MNLILLFPSDYIPGTNRVRLTGRRQRHVLEVQKAKVGQKLIIGIENGLIGDGIVVKSDDSCIEMEASFSFNPPPKLPVTLAVALMRPIVLKRVLQTVASMGVPEIMIFHSKQVEKSFWQSSALLEDAVREQLILGLEQAKDTVLPKVSFHKRFKPFVEDVLPRILGQGKAKGVVADPSGEPVSTLKTQDTRHRTQEKVSRLYPSLPKGACRPEGEGIAGLHPPLNGEGMGGGNACVLCPVSCVLVVGPEGGFIPYEIEKFREAGCHIVSMGERILRVETAVTALLAKLF